MSTTKYFTNTVMLCYNCRRTAVVRLKRSRRHVLPLPRESEVLDLVFVACKSCQRMPHVHNPFKDWLPSFVDPDLYKENIHHLQDIFRCTRQVVLETRFSMRSLGFVQSARIHDSEEIFDIPYVPHPNVIVIDQYRKLSHDREFFTRRKECCSTTDSRYLDTSDVPSANIDRHWVGCLSEHDNPPPYSTVEVDPTVRT